MSTTATIERHDARIEALTEAIADLAANGRVDDERMAMGVQILARLESERATLTGEPTREERLAEKVRQKMLDQPHRSGPYRTHDPFWRGADLETPALPAERVGGGR